MPGQWEFPWWTIAVWTGNFSGEIKDLSGIDAAAPHPLPALCHAAKSPSIGSVPGEDLTVVAVSAQTGYRLKEGGESWWKYLPLPLRAPSPYERTLYVNSSETAGLLSVLGPE